jgi:hypothetical protein
MEGGQCSAIDVFRFLFGENVICTPDEEWLMDMNKDLKNVPECFRGTPATVVGWFNHLEHQSTPWEDDDRLWYASESYLEKKFLKKTTGGDWILSNSEAYSLLDEWNQNLLAANLPTVIGANTSK